MARWDSIGVCLRGQEYRRTVLNTAKSHWKSQWDFFLSHCDFSFLREKQRPGVKLHRAFVMRFKCYFYTRLILLHVPLTAKNKRVTICAHVCANSNHSTAVEELNSMTTVYHENALVEKSVDNKVYIKDGDPANYILAEWGYRAGEKVNTWLRYQWKDGVMRIVQSWDALVFDPDEYGLRVHHGMSK